MRDRRLALGGDRPLVVVVRVAADGGVDGAAGRVGVALDQRVVALVDRALLELALQGGVRALRLGDDHQAGGADVEAVHDALALGGTGRRDAVPGGGEPADDRGPGPAGAGVGGDADRLHDHDHVIVVVDDLHALDRLGDDLHGRGRLRHLDLQPGPAVHTLGLPDHRAVDRDLPRRGQLGGLRTGEAEHAGDGGVDTLALQAVGHGQVSDLGNCAHPVEYAGRVRHRLTEARAAARTAARAVSPCGRCRPGPGRGRRAARSGCRRTRSPSRRG